MKNFIKSAAFKTLMFIALFLVGIMVYAASTGGVASIPEALTGAIVTPLQTLGATVSDGLQNFTSSFTDSGKLRKENAELQSEINELRDNQVELDQLRQENEFYKQYLQLHEQHSDFQFADGRVIAIDAAGKYNNFTINTGSLNGVKEKDPVITPEGLVGVVYETGLNYSKVHTILDPSTQVSAYIWRTNSSGVTGGTISLAQEGKLKMNYLSRDSGVASGDYVITAGSSIYPAGLKIGEIEEVDQESDGLTLYAIVKPFADIQNLTQVCVITSFDGQGETAD